MNTTENTQLAGRNILAENCFNHGQEISWISFFVFKIENASFQSMCQIFLNWKRILNYTRDCVCTGVVVYIYTAAILLKIKIWKKKKTQPHEKNITTCYIIFAKYKFTIWKRNNVWPFFQVFFNNLQIFCHVWTGTWI